MSFHWQTDEDTGEAIGAPPPAPDSLHRRRALWLVAAVALVSLATVFGWHTLQQRAAETEEAIKADVLAVHELARGAAESGDEELYLSLVAPPFDAWRAAQRELLQQDLLYTGSARLYDLMPLPTGAPAPEVVVNPDLRHATVFVDHAFAFTSTAHLQDAVSLRQMQTYSLGPDGWQLAPPPPDFWLPQIRLLGDGVTLEYPERDDDVARRLLPYLERLVVETCALPGLDCPSDLQLTVRFVSDPAALPRVIEPEAMLRGATNIDLPSPSLAGQPLDERAEALVVRAYATQTIAPLISHLSGYTCCAGGLLARATLALQFSHLGLRGWPLQPDDYETLMEEGLSLGNALVLQRRDADAPLPQTWRQALSVVHFLESALPPGVLLQQMGGSVDAWLAQSGDIRSFVAQWSDFTYARSRSAQLAQTFDLAPQGTLQLTCFERDAVAVLRYDFAEAAWGHSLTYAPPGGWQVDAVFPLESGAGDVIKESRRDAGGERLARYVWRHDGDSDVILETIPAAGGARLFDLPAASSYALAALLSPQFPALRASMAPEWWRVELTVCDGEVCDTRERLARPHWSADGGQILFEVRPDALSWTPEDLTVVRSDSLGQDFATIGRGYAPVWLGEGHYAYLREAPDGAADELLVAATIDDEAQLLATAADFIPYLEDDLQEGQRLRLEQIQPGLSNPHLLLVQATFHERPGDNNPDTYLFGLSLDPDARRPAQTSGRQALDIEPLFHSTTTLVYRLSPNGRWMAITGFSGWNLLDLRQSSTRALGSGGPPAWSPDGDWLAQSRSNDILLRHADLGYKRPIVQDLANCTFSTLQWQ